MEIYISTETEVNDDVKSKIVNECKIGMLNTTSNINKEFSCHGLHKSALCSTVFGRNVNKPRLLFGPSFGNISPRNYNTLLTLYNRYIGVPGIYYLDLSAFYKDDLKEPNVF